MECVGKYVDRLCDRPFNGPDLVSDSRLFLFVLMEGVMRKKEGYFLTVFLDHADDQDPIYIWIGEESTERAILQARSILESLIGWNDYFLGKYKSGYLDQAVRM
jgi:hypothetical protein